MRVVLGLSVTSGSAVWVLVDTYDGSIIADEVVALESVNEIARAAARSVQNFALHTDRDIDGVRLVWDDDARQHGIRLRTKLRLFGFDTVETVSEEAAREGRNRTARHIAPHMVLAYGAARADVDEQAGPGRLRRLVSRVPLRVPDSLPIPLTAAASVAALAVTGVVLYAFLGDAPSQETPETAVAEATIPEAALPAPEVVVPVAPAPALAAPIVDMPDAPVPAAVPDVMPDPQTDASVTSAADSVADSGASEYALPNYPAPDPSASLPAAESDPATAEIGSVQADTVVLPAEAAPALPPAPGVGSATTGTSTATSVEPHLTGVGPNAGPAAAAGVPTVPTPSAQAAPAAVGAPAPAPPAPSGPLGGLLGALP